MKRMLLILGILLLLVVAVVAINDYDKKRRLNLSHVIVPSPTPAVLVLPTESLEDPTYPYEASFKIVTNGFVRNFSDEIYQEKSQTVFIPSGQPQIVEVTEETTWQEFFDTLPIRLDDECLVTGDGEELCDGEGGTLSFELNGELVHEALTLTIESDDLLIVRYE